MFSYSIKLHTLGSPWPSFLKWRFPVWFVYFTWKSFCSTLTSKWTVYLPLFKCNRKCKEKKKFFRNYLCICLRSIKKKEKSSCEISSIRICFLWDFYTTFSRKKVSPAAGFCGKSEYFTCCNEISKIFLK